MSDPDLNPPSTPAAPAPSSDAKAGVGPIGEDGRPTFDPATLPSEAKTMAMLCHLLAIFTGFLGPLILWVVRGKDHPYIDYHGKSALNFSLTVLLAVLICIPLCIILIGFLLLPVVQIGGLVLTIMAAIAANEGKAYKYPFTLNLIK